MSRRRDGASRPFLLMPAEMKRRRLLLLGVFVGASLLSCLTIVAQAGAKLELSEESWDFQTVKWDTPAEHTFHLTNVGQEPAEIIKIGATTLGETGGDAVSMSMNLGYLIGTLIFAAIFFVVVAVQIKVDRFNPWLYWTTIIATTTAMIRPTIRPTRKPRMVPPC